MSVLLQALTTSPLKILSSLFTKNKQQGAITNPSNSSSSNIDAPRKVKGDYIVNYISPESPNSSITNSTTDEKTKTSSLFGKAQSETGSGSLNSNDQKPTSLLGRSQTTDTGGGDYTSKEGINTTTLMVIGGVVILAIFVLPMFIGGKK
jgi:hypothetical protein